MRTVLLQQRVQSIWMLRRQAWQNARSVRIQCGTRAAPQHHGVCAEPFEIIPRNHNVTILTEQGNGCPTEVCDECAGFLILSYDRTKKLSDQDAAAIRAANLKLIGVPKP